MKITKKDILSSVSRKQYNKGLDYAQSGRVDIRDVGENSARGVVVGTRRYLAEFAYSSGRLEGRCSCPASMNRDVCKHVIALALVYLDDDRPRSETDIVLSLLGRLSKQDLIDTIMQQTVEDPVFFHDLILGAARARVRITAENMISVARAGVQFAFHRAVDTDEALAELQVVMTGFFIGGDRTAIVEACVAAVAEIDRLGPIQRFKGWADDEDEDDFGDDAEDFVLLLAKAHRELGTSISDAADFVCRRYKHSGFLGERIRTFSQVFGKRRFEKRAYEALDRIRQSRSI